MTHTATHRIAPLEDFPNFRVSENGTVPFAAVSQSDFPFSGQGKGLTGKWAFRRRPKSCLLAGTYVW
jgi:hypothetical protein